MTIFAAIALAIILAFIGLLHLGWAAKIYWPFASEAEAARKTLSDQENLPPNAITAAVGIALLGAAYLVLAVAWPGLRFVPDWLYTVGMWALIAVLALRGIVEPIVYRTANPDYTRLNRRVYSPLCVVMALLGVFVVLS